MDNEHLFASAELLADKELKYGRARKVLTSKFLSDALVLEAVGDEAVARSAPPRPTSPWPHCSSRQAA